MHNKASGNAGADGSDMQGWELRQFPIQIYSHTTFPPSHPPHLHYIHRWKQQSATDHQDHMRHVAFRAILEAVTRGKYKYLQFCAVNDL